MILKYLWHPRKYKAAYGPEILRFFSNFEYIMGSYRVKFVVVKTKCANTCRKRFCYLKKPLEALGGLTP